MRILRVFGIGILVLFTACGPSASEKALKARQDSTRVADSLARVEIERIETARQDSIRRDSIELAEFIAAIPSPRELDYNIVYNTEKYAKTLKSKGFSVNKETEERYYDDGYGPGDPVEPGWYTHVWYTFTLKKENRKCVIKQLSWSWCTWTITIDGAPEFLNEYYNQAKAYVRECKNNQPNPEDGWVQGWYAKKTGNTIEVDVNSSD